MMDIQELQLKSRIKPHLPEEWDWDACPIYPSPPLTDMYSADAERKFSKFMEMYRELNKEESLPA